MDTGDTVMNQVALVMRLLHNEEMRSLQTEANRIIVRFHKRLMLYFMCSVISYNLYVCFSQTMILLDRKAPLVNPKKVETQKLTANPITDTKLGRMGRNVPPGR